MHAEKISDIIAHFVGLFDIPVEEDRIRIQYPGGKVVDPHEAPAIDLDALDRKFASMYGLDDYDPALFYKGANAKLIGVRPPHRADGPDYDWDPYWRGRIVRPDDYPDRPHEGPQPDDENKLFVFVGPGSSISHMTQVNLLQDDDYLNLKDNNVSPYDMRFVVERLNDYAVMGKTYTPFGELHRIDTYDGLQAIYQNVHSYSQDLTANDIQSFNEDAEVDFVLAANNIQGVYVNGQLVGEAPVIDDFMPDRGIAAPPKEPEESDVPLSLNDGPKDTLDVAAGANVVANIASVTNVGIIAPVMCVMGDYSQADVISQVTVYSDHDTGGFGSLDGASATTIAMNVGVFDRSSYEMPESSVDPTAPPVFPSQWQVSVVEGDVCFVQWMEQYNFVTDNDQMVLTTTGAETSVIIGGNAAVNLAAYFGMSMQYDLIIVGGNVLDMNIISQTAVLYDNDWIVGADGIGNVTFETGNNLLWNGASIHNFGENDRFEAVPDYMFKTVEAIEERDPVMPGGLATDPNFEGYSWLNVLYITGNLYDVSLIKQVSVLGDADHVTMAAQEALAQNPDAEVTVSTGGNAVVNLATIIDYDTFGQTTYLGGQLYSDAILIQGGIVDDDETQPLKVDNRLANEVIAFLDDPANPDQSEDGVINAGHDLSWSNINPADVMQTVLH